MKRVLEAFQNLAGKHIVQSSLNGPLKNVFTRRQKKAVIGSYRNFSLTKNALMTTKKVFFFKTATKKYLKV